MQYLKNDMKKVALIGGSGFIGVNFLDQMSSNYDITVFGRQTRDVFSLEEKTFDYLRLDIDSLTEQLSGFDVVINLASIKVKPSTPLSEYLEGIKLADQLMLACIKNQIKFIQLSSRMVYEPNQKVPWDEASTTLPVNYYGVSKLAIDHLLLAYNLTHHTGFISLRLAQVYGLRQGQIDPSQETFVVMKYIALARLGQDIPLFGSGTGARDYIFIDDVVHAIKLAIDSEEAGVFNIGSNQMVSYSQLAELVIEVFNQASKIITVNQPEDKSQVLLEITKANQRLGYTPVYSLSEGLQAIKERIK